MFALSVMQEVSLNKANLYLWLMRDATQHIDGTHTYTSPWLKAGLSASMYEPPKTDGVSQQVADARNVCMVYILSGKQRQCVTRLSGSSYRSMSNPNFVPYDDLFDEGRGLLCDDNLSIVCEVVLANETRFVRSWLYDPVKPEVVYRVEHTLVDDLKRMLNTGRGSDVTLVANDGQEFSAHVLILASRSPVFAAMFEHDMKEKQEKRVTFDDLSSRVVKGLLEFIYTDIVVDIATLAPELLPPAH